MEEKLQSFQYSRPARRSAPPTSTRHASRNGHRRRSTAQQRQVDPTKLAAIGIEAPQPARNNRSPNRRRFLDHQSPPGFLPEAGDYPNYGTSVYTHTDNTTVHQHVLLQSDRTGHSKSNEKEAYMLSSSNSSASSYGYEPRQQRRGRRRSAAPEMDAATGSTEPTILQSTASSASHSQVSTQPEDPTVSSGNATMPPAQYDYSLHPQDFRGSSASLQEALEAIRLSEQNEQGINPPATMAPAATAPAATAPAAMPSYHDNTVGNTQAGAVAVLPSPESPRETTVGMPREKARAIARHEGGLPNPRHAPGAYQMTTRAALDGSSTIVQQQQQQQQRQDYTYFDYDSNGEYNDEQDGRLPGRSRNRGGVRRQLSTDDPNQEAEQFRLVDPSEASSYTQVYQQQLGSGAVYHAQDARVQRADPSLSSGSSHYASRPSQQQQQQQQQWNGSSDGSDHGFQIISPRRSSRPWPTLPVMLPLPNEGNGDERQDNLDSRSTHPQSVAGGTISASVVGGATVTSQHTDPLRRYIVDGLTGPPPSNDEALGKDDRNDGSGCRRCRRVSPVFVLTMLLLVAAIVAAGIFLLPPHLINSSGNGNSGRDDSGNSGNNNNGGSSSSPGSSPTRNPSCFIDPVLLSNACANRDGLKKNVFRTLPTIPDCAQALYHDLSELLGPHLVQLANHDTDSGIGSNADSQTGDDSPSSTTTTPDVCHHSNLALMSLAAAVVSHPQVWAVPYFALANLYYATNGHAWNSQTNWFRHPDICQWYGLECRRDTTAGPQCSFDITQNMTVCDEPEILHTLDLSVNNMNGTLPTQIGLLSTLQLFRIHANQVNRGGIPSEIGNMKELGE